MTGQVEKFADIRPGRVRLSGTAGSPIVENIEIIPRPDYPFNIEQIRAKNGEFIVYELVQKLSDENDRYIIRVENTKKDRGRYMDVLYLDTDNENHAVIPIYITGIIK